MIDFIDFMIRLVLAHKNTHDADMRLPSAANTPDIGRFKVFSVSPIDKTQVVAYNNAVND